MILQLVNNIKILQIIRTKLLFAIFFVSLLSCSSIEETISSNLSNLQEGDTKSEEVSIIEKESIKDSPSNKEITKAKIEQATTVPPTSTSVQPTATSVPPTATSVPPTATSVPPTATPVPPTATPVPPTKSRIQYPRDYSVLINLSKYNDEDILSWENTSYNKLSHKENKAIFSFIYPIGRSLDKESMVRGKYVNEHEVLLSEEEISHILTNMDTWMQNNTNKCTERKLEPSVVVTDFEQWIRYGADLSTQSAECKNLRIIAIAIPQESGLASSQNDFKNTFIHEYYHAQQNDLDQCNIKGDFSQSNSIWFVEGGAHYFSTSILAKESKKNIDSEILRMAYDIRDLSEDELIGQPDKWGAAALLLMTKLNLLSENSIMDSSLFDNCARENDFDSNSREIQHVKKHWKSIENKNGIFSFKKEALSFNKFSY